MLKYTGKIIYVNLDLSCLKQDRITFNHGEIVNMYIVYDLKSTLNYDEDITLENCSLKMLILLTLSILDMVLDLMEKLFHFLMVVLVTIE